MNKLPKCRYCGTLLSSTDSVLININRYDKNGKSSKGIMMCCRCWNRVKILIDERCTDCKYADSNSAFDPCKTCTHCYMSHFEEDK